MVLLVIALAAAQLLPFLDLSAHSQRGVGYADTRWSMPGWGWVNFLVPMAFGGAWTEGVFFQYGQSWTSSYYLGIGTLWLAVLALWTVRDRRVWLLGGAAILALIFAFGENSFVYPALRKIIPQLSFVTYPVKYVTLVAFLMPLLAAFGLAQLQNLEGGDTSPLFEAPTRRRTPNILNRILFTGAILFALLAGILIWAWRYPFPTDDVHATLLNGLARAFFLLATGWLFLLLAQETKMRRLLLILLVGILLWMWRFPYSTDDINSTLFNSLSRTSFLLVACGLLLLLLAVEILGGLRRIAPLLLLVVAWLDVFTHEPAQNPTVPPSVYEPNLARADLKMDPQPELGGSRAMITTKAFMDFIHFALSDPKNNFLGKRLGFCGNANLLDAVPKVDGFFSLTPREGDDLNSLLYGTTNEFPRLEDFMGVSQITAPDEFYRWQPRPTFLPLVTAGQKPVFLNDADTLRALTLPDFDGSKVVFLPPEATPFVTVTNQTAARVLKSHFGIQSVDIEVEAGAPSLVVVAQTWYHNWRAEVDGKPARLLRANHAFQAVEIPEGRHRVQLIYRDRTFEIGAMASLLALFACLICVATSSRQKTAHS